MTRGSRRNEPMLNRGRRRGKQEVPQSINNVRSLKLGDFVKDGFEVEVVKRQAQGYGMTESVQALDLFV